MVQFLMCVSHYLFKETPSSSPVDEQLFLFFFSFLFLLQMMLLGTSLRMVLSAHM